MVSTGAFFATLNGTPAARVAIRVPGVGAWRADVALDAALDALPSGRVTLKLGNLTLVGTVVPAFSGTFAEQTFLRVVAGGAGWSKILPSKAYHNDAGVKSSQVLTDAAREAGETLGSIPSSVPSKVAGVDFLREVGPASRVFGYVLGTAAGWWVDYAGVTQFGTRPVVAPAPGAEWEFLDYFPEQRIAVLATSDPSAVQVGMKVTDSRLTAPLTIRELEFEVGPGPLRVRAWVDEASSTGPVDHRALRVLRALVREALPNLDYLGLHQYRVVSMDNGRANLQAVKKKSGVDMPDASLAKLSPGMAGLTSVLTPGAIVLVGFADGDPSLPVITHYATPDDPAFKPVSVSIDAATVQVGPSANSVELGSGSEAVDYGSEPGRVVRYGDSILVPIVGGVAKGALLQNPDTAPNQIARVQA